MDGIWTKVFISFASPSKGSKTQAPQARRNVTTLLQILTNGRHDYQECEKLLHSKIYKFVVEKEIYVSL